MTSDADLYRRWTTSRDEDAFGELAHRHADLVHDVAWRVSGDAAAAEDALQEALHRLARDGTDRPAQVGVRSWLARSAIHRARDRVASDRARARRERDAAAHRREEIVDAAPQEIRTVVERALARVEGESHAVLALRFLHGVGYPELAQVLGVSEGAARVRVHRALEEVRRESGLGETPEAALTAVLLGIEPHPCPPGSLGPAVRRAVAGARRAPGGTLRATRLGAGRFVWPAAAGLALVLAAFWFLGPRGDPQRPSEADPRRIDRAEAGGGPLLAGRPAAASGGGPALPTMPADGTEGVGETAIPPRTSRMRVRLKAFDGRPLEMRPSRLAVPGDPRAPSADFTIAVKPGERIELFNPSILRDLEGVGPGPLLEWVTLDIPSPVPETLEVRLPHPDEPRLSSLRLRVLDEATGEPLPRAYVDPGRYGLDLGRIPADAQGVIEVPYARALHWHSSHGAHGSFVSVAAPGHRPRSGLRFSAEDWAAWDATGALPVRLPRWTPPKAPVPLRFVHDDGRPAVGLLAETRGFVLGGTFERTPYRADADGRVDVFGPVPLVLDLTWEDSPIGTVVLDGLPAREGAQPREIRLPPLVRVRLEVRGAPEGGPPFDAAIHTRLRTILDPGSDARLGTRVAGTEGFSFDEGRAGYYVERSGAFRPPLAIDLWVPQGAEAQVQFDRSLDSRTWENGRWGVPATASGDAVVRTWEERERGEGNR